MKRFLCAGLSALLLTGCTAANLNTDDLQPVQIIAGAETKLSASDGYVYLEDSAARTLSCQMLIPKAVGWYRTTDGTVRYCDPSGQSLFTFEYRSGDDYARCYESYLHEIGTELPANRICTYEPQTVGVGAYNAYRIDARETEDDLPERMMTFWFIEKPHAAGRRSGCYIVTLDTTAENLDVVSGCIQSFSTLSDFDPDREFDSAAPPPQTTEGDAAK